jgi:pimeloyl-ACP methyl ester carboxylesterase
LSWTDSVLGVGSGDHVVVCLHGWFGSHEGWGYLPDVVDGERFTYVFPDMRGYGARKDEEGDFTMWEFGSDAVALADARGWERFSVVGHSMGGKAAAAVLAQAGHRLRSLVGMAAVGPGPVPLDEDGTALFYGAPQDDQKRRAIIDFTTGNRHGDAWLDRMVVANRATSSEAAYTAAGRSWIEDDYTDRLGEGAPPMLLLTGEHDPALSAGTMQQTWVPRFPEATVTELPACGHYPMHEVPVALATELERFLARH